MVDPYDWLGLPKSHRPPTHYQLLGLPTDATDPTTIRAAADRQHRRLLSHMTGPHPLEAERVWAEIEDARDTLLDPDRKAQYDALSPNDGGADSPPAEAPAATGEAPLSPEELAAATEPDPDPWWKSAPEAPVGPQPWWKETAPAEHAPPPPPPPRPAPASGTAVAPPRSTRHTAPGRKPGKRRKSSVVPVLLGGLVVAGLIGGGVYLGFGRKHSTPTPPGPSIVEGPKGDPKPKTPDPETPKGDDPAVEPPLPKDFADQLRPKNFPGHQGAVNALAVAGSGTRFATVGTDRTVRVWSITKDEPNLRHTFAGPAAGVAWCDRDRRLAAADGHSLVVLEAMRNTPAGKPMDSPRGGVTALAATADGGRALTGLTDGYLRLWDTAAGRSDEWPAAARGAVTAVAVAPDGSQAVAAVTDGPVSVWNLVTRNRVQEWSPHPGGAIAVSLSPDGTRVATGGADGAGAVYDLGAKKEVCRLDGHAGPVTGIAWLPDGRQVVTVSVDGTARLWSADTGYPLRWSQALAGKGNCVAVDPGGRFVLAGTSTGVTHLFPLPRVRPEAVAGPAGKPPTDPLLVPDPADVAAALTPVRTELAREFGYTRPDDMALLADNLRRRSGTDQLSPPLRYGLLQEARTLAARAGDAVTAFRAVEDLAAWFEVDELAEKAATFAALPPEADDRALVAVGLAAAERAETDARPEVVDRLLKRLPATPPAGTPADQVTRLANLRQRAAAAAAESRAVLLALDVLKNAADEPKANQALGTFLCFTRQDWAAGLPHLYKGADSRLADIAKTDVSAPTDPKAQHRLAEQWFALANDAKDHRHRRALLGRARTWLERELKAKLETVDAVKARARLDDVAKLDVPAKDPLTLPLFTPAPVRRAYNTLGPDVLKHEWVLAGGAAGGPDGVVLPAGGPAVQSRFGLAPGGRLTLAVRPDGRELRVVCAGQEFAFAGNGKAVRLTVERAEDKVTVTATADDGAPVARTLDLPATLRGPTPVAVRPSGAPVRDGGTVLVSAIARGPVSFPPPVPE